MEMVIKPFEGVGPIKFGMKPEEVSKAVGKTPRRFQKYPPPGLPSDDYSKQGILAHYNSKEECHDLEFDVFGLWWTELTFHDLPLSSTPYETFLNLVKELDPQVAVGGGGFTSLALGISMQLDGEQLYEEELPPSEVGVGYLAVMGPGSLFLPQSEE
jgi:hypothetical protein